jgi:FixJ family two-component response regulator
MQNAYRILIVDDDAEVRETLKQILSETGGAGVDCAADGEAGFSMIKEQSYDLVFIDIRLPGIDGLELLRLIKRYDPTLAVVMITGFPSVDSAIQTMKDGAADFITKPFRFQQIEHLVQKQLFHREQSQSGNRSVNAASEDQTAEALDARLNSKIKELSILYSISESMGATDFDVDRFYDRIVEMASTITGAERTSLMILDREANELRIKAAKGLSQKVVGSARVPLGSGVAGRVVTSGKPLLVKNSRVSSLQTGRKDYRTESYVSIPLTIKGEDPL